MTVDDKDRPPQSDAKHGSAYPSSSRVIDMTLGPVSINATTSSSAFSDETPLPRQRQGQQTERPALLAFFDATLKSPYMREILGQNQVIKDGE